MFRKILGLDLLPGESPQASQDPHLAYALLVNGEVEERGVVSLRDLLSLIERERVEAVAVDNVYELAPSISELQGLLSSLQNPPRLVQVTLIGDKSYPLPSLAACLGLGGGKLSPHQAAEVAARLCYMGVGSELLLFELNETRIVVAKGRSPSQGGMSAERFRRSVEGRVLEKTNELRQLLSEKGFDFDLFVTKGAYGVERSVFIVYAPRERLYGLVRPLRDHDLQIRIEPVAKRKPSFVPLLAQGRRLRPRGDYLIVGVDPGVSVGVAALTLGGELRLLTSGRELGRGQVIRLLLEVGSPIVVSTDVSPPPDYVKKLAATLNAVLVSPPRPLTIEDKRRLVNEFSSTVPECPRIRDPHQRDALAAALFALRQLQPKFDEVRERVDRLGLKIPVEEVKALVAKGAPIWEAIRQVSKSVLVPEARVTAPQSAARPVSGTVKPHPEELVKLERTVKELELEREKLMNKINELESFIDRILTAQSYEIRKEKEIEKMQSKLLNLSKEVESLAQQVEHLKGENKSLREILARVADGELVVVPRLSSLGSATDQPPSRVVVVGALAPTDLERIRQAVKRLSLRAIICEQECPAGLAEALACDGVALLTVDEASPLTVLGSVYVFDRRRLESAMEGKLRELEKGSLEYARNLVRNIINSYRAERGGAPLG